jgi:nuclear cap-binding protein subunit 1
LVIQTRFFAELANANVIEAGQLIGLLDLYLNVAEEPGVNQERVDAYVYVVLATIPFAAMTLKEKALQDFQRVYSKIETFIETRQAKLVTTGISAAHETLSVYQSKTEPYVMQDRLELLWSQIVNLKNDNWQVPIVVDLISAFSEDLDRQICHEIPKITIPSSVTAVKFLYQPKFWVFDDSVNVPGEKPLCHLPSTTTISRFVLDDVITDTIRIFSLNHKECSKLLLKTDSLLNIDFIERQGIQIYEAIVEAIFSEMFRLPKTHERFVYYTTLIIDLCKESLDKIPSALGRSIKIIFKRLQGMDIECVKRFSDFFAIHLSNFGFSWRWADWEFVLDQDRSSMQFVFVREALNKCVRLAFHERIKNSIPESFEAHGRIFPSSPPDFHFLYTDSEKVGHPRLFELCSALSNTISNREEMGVVENTVSEIERFVAEDGHSLQSLQSYFLTPRNSHTLAHDVLFQCIMHQGSKSFSHLLNVIERYLPLLQKWNDTPEKRLLTTEVTCQFWAKNSQFLEIILGKLINYRILDSKAIISWLISDSTLDAHYDQFYVWNILNSTLHKLQLRQEQILQKLEKAKTVPDAEAAMEGSFCSFRRLIG